jgi:pyruvate/2-oxoglutarate dehydrogenase complex dihydrolipoamide dehydrogenase (E3) component
MAPEGRGGPMEGVHSYDAVIVGAGTAGVPLAQSLAAAGWHTAIIERTHVGGTCINEGCTPTKNMISSARVAYLSRRAPSYGIATGDVAVDMAAVRQRKRDLVDSWRGGSERRLANTANLDLIMGEAAFLGPRRLEIRSSDAVPAVVEAGHIFVNTGCRPAIPPLPGLEKVPYLTSTTVIELDSVPEHLLILGGGYAAVEFAQMFRRFGSKVTVVQRRDQLLPREDPDVAQAVAAILEEDGVALVLEADTRSVKGTADGGIQLDIVSPAGTISLVGSHLLVATGRAPNTEALNVAAAGLRVDEKGYLPVNERLETDVDGIYALGDVKGGPAFTHIAYDDFRVVRTNLLEGGGATIADRLVPYVVFLDPQLGRVGLSEREAKQRGYDLRVASMPMNYVGRALEIDESRGLMKVMIDNADDRILGCAVLGVEGGETMSVMQAAMMGGLTASRLRDAVFAHPTLAESLNNLFAR